VKYLLLLLFIGYANAQEYFFVSTKFKTNHDKYYYLVRAIDQIRKNNPNINIKESLELAQVAFELCRKHDVPLNVVLGIAFVESSYRLNAVNKGSNDFGIMQVNDYHVKKSKLDKNRLLTDISYSFEQGILIFKWFYNKYPLEEAIARYNCGTRDRCVHLTSVQRYVRLVKIAM